MDLVIVGSIGYDDIETPVATGSDVLGGSAVHAGVSAAFHLPETPEGVNRVGLVAPIGKDFSNSHQSKLENLGIDLSGVKKLPGKTFRWSGRYSGTMENVETISTEVNVLGDFVPEIPEPWKSPNILFCANTHPASQVLVLDQCPSSEITAIDTFMLWIETEFESLSSALRKADLAILNEEEVCAISGEEVFMKAVEPILSGSCLHGGESAGKGPRGLVIKRGSSGVFAHLPCGIIALPSYPISEIVDPTGCGDSFAGAFLANISGRKGVLNDLQSMRDAMVHATVSSSFTIQGLGSNKLQGLERGLYHARMDRYRRIVGL
ncbi:MAG TPA: PfkB family carbohydrate kinase [Candidatus Thalassarchaeaceae archaeon]|nr:PfkB family carbohydrate kinase [Candidatus Thalassarchaeaceae archaeon]